MKRSKPMPPPKAPMKRTEFKRKPGSGLKRTGFTQKPRKPLPRRSKRRAEKQRMAKILHRDSCGMSLMESQRWLPKTNNWPDPGDVDNQSVLETFVRLHAIRSTCIDGQYRTWAKCWLCGRERWCDVAHIVPRSDELANLMMLCSLRPEAGYDDSCHYDTEKNPEMLPKLLLAKLANDFEHTNFLRIAQLRKQAYKFDSLD